MATLRNVNGASLVPDFSQGLNNLFKGIEARKAQEAEQARQQQIGGLIGQLSRQPVGAAAGDVQTFGLDNPGVPVEGATPGINPEPNRQAALMRLMAIDPKIGKEVAGVIQSGDEARVAELGRVADREARTAFLLESEATREGKQRVLRQMGEEILATEGADSPRFQTVLRQMNMSDEELDLAIRRGKLGAANMKELATDALKPKELKAPITRELKKGNQIITQQLNPRTGAFETIAEGPRFNPKAGVTVNLGAPSDGLAVRPLTPEEMKGLNIDQENAKGLVVDAKGDVKALDTAKQTPGEVETEKADAKQKMANRKGKKILSGYRRAFKSAPVTAGLVLPGKKREALEQRRNALIAHVAKNILGTPGAEPSPSLYEKAAEIVPDYSGAFDRDNFNEKMETLEQMMETGKAPANRIKFDAQGNMIK